MFEEKKEVKSNVNTIYLLFKISLYIRSIGVNRFCWTIKFIFYDFYWCSLLLEYSYRTKFYSKRRAIPLHCVRSKVAKPLQKLSQFSLIRIWYPKLNFNTHEIWYREWMMAKNGCGSLHAILGQQKKKFHFHLSCIFVEIYKWFVNASMLRTCIVSKKKTVFLAVCRWKLTFST